MEDNKIILAIGTSGAILAKTVEYLDKTKINGLGYLDMEVIRKRYCIWK